MSLNENNPRCRCERSSLEARPRSRTEPTKQLLVGQQIRQSRRQRTANPVQIRVRARDPLATGPSRQILPLHGSKKEIYRGREGDDQEGLPGRRFGICERAQAVPRPVEHCPRQHGSRRRVLRRRDTGGLSEGLAGYLPPSNDILCGAALPGTTKDSLRLVIRKYQDADYGLGQVRLRYEVEESQPRRKHSTARLRRRVKYF